MGKQMTSREDIKITTIKTLTELIIKLIFWGIIIPLIAFVITYLIPTKNELVELPTYGKVLLALLVASTTAAISMLVWVILLKQRHEQFQEAFGVLWDKKDNIRCLGCKKPLKNSTVGPSIFFCSDPKCNSKHVLKKSDGIEMTLQEARKCLKQSLKD